MLLIQLSLPVVIDCGGLTDPESGQVTISPGIVAATGLNAVAMYTCNDGYDLVGDTMRTCQSDAQWNGTEPVCMSKSLVFLISKVISKDISFLQ